MAPKRKIDVAAEAGEVSAAAGKKEKKLDRTDDDATSSVVTIEHCKSW